MGNISGIKAGQLLEELTGRYKNFTIIISIVLVSFFFAGNVYRQQVSKSELLKEDIRIETEKSAALDRIVLLNERLKKIKEKGWGALDSSKMMEVISNLAIESGVKISDVSPQEKLNEKNYVLFPFSLHCEATYKDFVKFLRAVESYPALFRVRELNMAAMDSPEAGAGSEGKDIRLGITLTLCSVYYK